jgi:hypothetical protein
VGTLKCGVGSKARAWSEPRSGCQGLGNPARLAAAGTLPPDVARRAAETVRAATAAMRAAPAPGVASAVAYAAADLLSATAHAWEGRTGGPLSDAAEWFDRAAHDLHGRVPARWVSQAGHLRAMARLIAVMGTVSRDRDTLAALHLIYTLAALAESLADLRQAQERLHQARAARHAAGQLRQYQAPAGRAGRPRAVAGPAVHRPARPATLNPARSAGRRHHSAARRPGSAGVGVARQAPRRGDGVGGFAPGPVAFGAGRVPAAPGGLPVVVGGGVLSGGAVHDGLPSEGGSGTGSTRPAARRRLWWVGRPAGPGSCGRWGATPARRVGWCGRRTRWPRTGHQSA